jgi:hypothetical protein
MVHEGGAAREVEVVLAAGRAQHYRRCGMVITGSSLYQIYKPLISPVR